MKPLISLCLMVKNEAKSIAEVLKVAKLVVDRVTVLDTGSTDGTQDIVADTMVNADMRGRLFCESFVDYATTRNRTLQLDSEREDSAEFQLVLSGDEFLRHGDKLREYLETQRDSDVDLFFIPLFIDDVRSFQPRVFRTGSNWRYKGVVHETPVNDVDEEKKIAFIHGPLIEHVIADREKRNETIWEVHIPLLQKELENNPNDERSLIFLAQSYDALMPFFTPEERAEYAEESMLLYKKRLDIPTGNDVERNWVEMHMLDAARLAGSFTDQELFDWATELAKRDPHRPEAALLCAKLATTVRPALEVYELYKHAAEVAAKADAIDNTSPVDMSVKWKAHYFAAVAAKQLYAKNQSSNFDQIMRDHIAAGIACGGDWSSFQSIVPITCVHELLTDGQCRKCGRWQTSPAQISL